MADAEWTRASDGSQGVYPGEAGLVGTPNTAGNWCMWIPRPGVEFAAQYWGRTISVMNNGDGSYTLTVNGVTRRHRYAYRWTTGAFFDAGGNVISSPADAAIAGTPGEMFFQPGYTESGGGAQAVNPQSQQTTQQAAQTTTQQPTGQTVTQTTQRAPGAPDPATTRTSSSDGRTDVFAGDSGMVGMFNDARNAWVIFVPPAGIDYVSYYWGGDIAMRNNGDGTYWLDADGVKAKRVYAPRWQVGKYYDRNGREVSSPELVAATGDPADIFFLPGQLAPDAQAMQGQTTAPVNPQPQHQVEPQTGRQQDVTNIPASGGGSNVTPYNPGTTDFPTVPITSPDGGAESGISKGVLIAAAIAAFALLK